MAILLRPRQTYGNGNGCPSYAPYYRNGSCYSSGGYSRWDGYGRWIVLAAVLLGAFFIFFIFACITARRRRRNGMNPYRGTGWAAGSTPAGHAPAQYTGAQPYYANNQQNYQGQNDVAPPYSPSHNQGAAQGYYGNNQGGQGYFGGQQNGIELQQPNNTYQPQRGGDAVYSPPPGPPPGKADGIIR